MPYFNSNYIFDQDNYVTYGEFIVSGKIIVPELHYWFKKFNNDNDLNLKRYPKPTALSDYEDTTLLGNSYYVDPDYTYNDYTYSEIYNNSFIELLFNEEWDKPKYSYMYTELVDRSMWPKNIYRIAMMYPKDSRYFILSPGGLYNIFGLSYDDRKLLNLLLQYRVGSIYYVREDYVAEEYFSTEQGIQVNVPYVNVEYVDFGYVDSGSYLEDNFIFENLTELGKLIYIYLDAKMNNSIEKYDSNTLISSSDNLLTSMYEAFVLETVFDVLHSRDKDTILI